MVEWGKAHHEWYGQPVVRNEIYWGLKDRYLSIKKRNREGKWETVRYNRIFNSDFILNTLEKWQAVEVEHKLYFDLARVNSGAPIFSWNVSQRLEQKKKFDEMFENYLEGVDFGVDVDAAKDSKGNKGKWEATWKRARKIKQWLDKKHKQYCVWNSSENGFQFFMHQWREAGTEGAELVKEYKKIAGKMQRECKVKVDMSIYDTRRFIKLPYSMCGENVVLPLSDEQFDVFDPESTKYYNVLKAVHIKGRGWLMRNE